MDGNKEGKERHGYVGEWKMLLITYNGHYAIEWLCFADPPPLTESCKGFSPWAFETEINIRFKMGG